MADYGSDISTFDDAGQLMFDPMFGVVEGPMVVAQCCARRLMTAPGTDWAFPDMGYDLPSQLGTELTEIKKVYIRRDIQRELEKDERVRRALVTEFVQTSRDVFRILVQLLLLDGPFTLVLSADKLLVTPLEIVTG